jgi:hypothetical protein
LGEHFLKRTKKKIKFEKEKEEKGKDAGKTSV